MDFEKKNRALILKKHSKDRFSIFDYASGMIKVHCLDTFFMHRIHSGFTISYCLEKNKPWINNIEIIQDAHLFFYYEFYLAHHLLELLYYFLPPFDSNQKLFTAMHDLFGTHLSSSLSVLQKKIILLRFFMYLGMYPEESLWYNAIPNDLINKQHAIVDYALPKQVEHYLTEWLAQCIAMHPQHAKFKTNLNTLFVYGIV